MSAVKQFLSLTDDCVCVIDTNGIIQEINTNWKKKIDIKVGTHELVDLFHEESIKLILKEFFNKHDQVSLKIPNVSLVDVHGNYYKIDLKIRYIEDQNRYWCLVKDISKKYHSIVVLDQISDSLNLGDWEYHSKNDKLKISKKLNFMLGMESSREEFSLKDLEKFFSTKDFETLLANESRDFEYTFHATIKDQMKWINLRGIRESLGPGIFSFHGIVRDVTIEKLKEQARLASNIELSSFEKGLDQFSIVARTDARGRIIQVNDEFCRISKYSEDELIGEDHRILNSEYHSKAFFQDMWQSIKEGNNWRGEIKNKAKDGSFYWVDTVIIPIRDSFGNLSEILSFRYEITNLKREQELNAILKNQLELLEKKNRIPLWSYDIKKDKLECNNEMLDWFSLKSDPSFDSFLMMLEDFDSTKFQNLLFNSAITEFSEKFMFNGRVIKLKAKIVRGMKSEPLRIDGVCAESLDITCKIDELERIA